MAVRGLRIAMRNDWAIRNTLGRFVRFDQVALQRNLFRVSATCMTYLVRFRIAEILSFQRK